MPLDIDPPGTGGAVPQKPSSSPAPRRGRTSDARDVEEAGVETPYHQDLRPAEELKRLPERGIAHQDTIPLLPGSDEEDDDEFFDAPEEFYQEPVPEPTSTEAQQVTLESEKNQPKGNLIERFFAVLLIWAMNLARVRSKLSLDAAAAVSDAGARIADLRQQEKMAKKSGNPLVRQQSQQELRVLKQNRAQAKAARFKEYIGYLKFLRALQHIHQKKVDRHDVHLSGLTLGGGRVALKDVDLSVSKVDLIESQEGHSVPRITTDINGFVEIPFRDRPPLRVRLEMKDVTVTAEGRLAPIAKAIIGKHTLPNIIRQLIGVKKGKGKLFGLSRFGIEAGSIKMTLENADSETLAALITRARSTRGRSIDKIFTSLGLPLEFKTDELELTVAPEPEGATPTPLVCVRKLHVHYHPPASTTQLESDPCETRELGISADVLDISTQGVSTAVAGTIQQLTPEVMELMPGESIPQRTWLKHLEGQSTGLTAHVEDFDLSLGREVVKREDKVELTGGDQLKLRTGPIKVHNKGRAKLDFTARQVRVSGSKEGTEKTYALDATNYSITAELEQPLPKDKGSVDIHGEVSGEQFLVAGFADENHTESQVVLKKSEIKTHQQASSLQIGQTKIDLPKNLEGSVENIQATHRREHGRQAAEVLVEQTQLEGEGDVRIKTAKHEFTVPVHGEVSNTRTSIQWQGQKEGAFGQRHSDLTIKPGKLSLENIELDQFHIGKAGFDIDDHMTGKMVLKDIEVDLVQCLGENTPLSHEAQSYIPEEALKGRKIRLSMECPVNKGEILFPESRILECTLDNKGADKETWTGWGVTKALNIAGYLKSWIGGYAGISVEDIRTTNGRLWIKPKLSLVEVGAVAPWIPLFKIPGYDVKGDTGVMLPELLHKYTGAHFTELDAEEISLISRVNSGQPGTGEELVTYCRRAGRDKASHILKAININPWLKLAETGDDKARLTLAALYPVFREFPAVAGKALSISLMTGWPVTAEDIEYFCSEDIAKHLDPIPLTELVSRSGDFDRARSMLTPAITRTPGNAELYWHEYNVIKQQIRASARKPDADTLIPKLRKEQITVLRQAARLGHSEAMTELDRLAQQGNALAKLAHAGMALAKGKTAKGFYSAVQYLEEVSEGASPELSETAREILIRRVRNSRTMFIHALPELDELLARQNRLIISGKELQLTADELYQWGLRYLYGVEDIQPDTAEAIKLLQLAKSQGFRQARTHIEIINRMQEG